MTNTLQNKKDLAELTKPTFTRPKVLLGEGAKTQNHIW